MLFSFICKGIKGLDTIQTHYSEHLQAIGLNGFCRTTPGEFYFHLGFHLFDPGCCLNDLVLYGFKRCILKLGSPEHFSGRYAATHKLSSAGTDGTGWP